MSITSNSVLTDMKFATVRPLFKKNSRSDVGTGQHKALSQNILRKQCITNLKITFLRKKLIYSLQSGLRGSYSTDTCLIYLTDYIRSQMAAGKYTKMALLDFQKAFDTEDHEILCSKLQTMGIHFDSVKWFKLYVSNRQKFVSLNQVESKPVEVTCDVPQGSILGLLLFCDTLTALQQVFTAIYYADDSALFTSHKDPKVICDVLSRELELCS